MHASWLLLLLLLFCLGSGSVSLESGCKAVMLGRGSVQLFSGGFGGEKNGVCERGRGRLSLEWARCAACNWMVGSKGGRDEGRERGRRVSRVRDAL
jgi:hypothetical protein